MSLTERRIQLAILSDIRSSIVCAAPNYTPRGWWECDLWAVTRAGYATEYEIKLSAADFRADAKKARAFWEPQTGNLMGAWTGNKTKHTAITESEHAPSRFYYVMPREIADELQAEIPKWAGLVTVKEWHGRLVVAGRLKAPTLNHRKVTRREIALCQRRMWYRYWDALRDIDRMRDDLIRTQRMQLEPA